MNFSSNRWKQLAGVLKEGGNKRISAIGSDDSVDGPYTEISPLQPMEQDTKCLQEGEGEYPATASEYAKKLNAEHDGLSKLVSDQEHWEKVGIYSGEDLARYLAISSYVDTYKDSYGIRPRHVKFSNLSIGQIVELTDDIMKDALGEEEEVEEDDYEDEYPVDFDDAVGDNDPAPGDEYSALENEMDRKHHGRSF